MPEESKTHIALEMLRHEGNLVWSRFNVFLVANSIIITSIVILLVNNETCLFGWLAVAGLILCLLWGILTTYGFYRCKHYKEVAKVEIKNLFGRHGGWLAPFTAVAIIVIFGILYVVFLIRAIS